MKKVLVFLCFLTIGNILFAQDQYPQVTKFKQKCYEIYDKMGLPSSDVKDLVYKNIDHICDSIVGASSLEYPYIDLQVVPKKKLVETAISRAEIEITRIKEKQAQEEKERLEKEAREAQLKAEREAQAKKEQEERERKEKEEAERIAAEKAKIAELETKLPNAINNALTYASQYDEIFNAEAYKMFMNIFDMHLNGKLKYTNTKTTDGVEFVGWVNESGIPNGYAIVTKHLDANVDYVYSGIFYDGKPILGELKTWAPRYGQIAAKLFGFINLQNKPYNGKPTYVMAVVNDNRKMMRYDGNGKVDGLLMEEYYYRIVKDTEEIIDVVSADEKGTTKKIYDYYTKQYPQTATKVVEGFPLDDKQVYTGGWKDGNPAGTGVRKVSFRKYAFIDFAENGAMKQVFDLDAERFTYYSMTNNDNVWFIHNGAKYGANGVLVPHDNMGIGIAFSYRRTDDDEDYEIALVKTSSDKPYELNEISYDYLNSFSINLQAGYIYFQRYDLNGEEIDFIGINCKKGTYTMRQFDKTRNQRIIKLMCKDGTYFEGNIVSENMYLGVHYGRGEYVYVGYVDADVKYNGEGYLLDSNDGEIMRQGLWNNNNLSETRDVKLNIDDRYPINKSEVLTTNKTILNKNSGKLSTIVKFDFPNVNLK